MIRNCTDCNDPVSRFGAHRDGYLCPSCACARLRKAEIEIADLKARLAIQRVNDLDDGYRDGAEMMREKAIECCLAEYRDDGTAQTIEAAIRALTIHGDDK